MDPIGPTTPSADAVLARVAELRAATAAPGADTVEVAQELADLSTALAEAGRHDEAVTAQRAAVDVLAAQSTGGPVPAVLLPVRMELRYLTGADGPELAIRVVPDDIAVQTFEPELTDAERVAGTAYWTAASAPAATAEERAAAWSAILARLGPARAAWAVDALRPGGQAVGRRAATWTRPATSRVLPDRFVFRGWRGDELVFEVTGADIPDDLALGPAPTDPVRMPAWITNHATAVAVGLGVRVPLTGSDLSLDAIVAVGLSDRAAADAAARLGACLQGHVYTDGLAFPPPGTPTNNTPATRADWSSAPAMRTPDEVAVARAAARPASGQPAVALADAFGLPATGRDGLLAAAGGTDRDDESHARQAHTMVAGYYVDFPGDWGSRLGGWLSSPELRAHFVDRVRAQGPLPAVRIGRQPYGVLPTTSLTMGAADPGTDAVGTVVTRLRALRATIAKQLPASPRIRPGLDQDAVLLDLLHRLPGSRAVFPFQTDADIDHPGARPRPSSVDLPLMAVHQRGPLCELAPEDALPATEGAIAGLVQRVQSLIARTEAGVGDWDGSENAPWFTQLREERGSILESFPGGEPFPVDLGLFWLMASSVAALSAWLGTAVVSSRHQAEQASDAAKVAQLSADLAATKQLLAELSEFVPEATRDLRVVDRALAHAVDALTTRVDAWATSVATVRLRAMRDLQPSGVRLGAYGWLVDVAPEPASLRRADQSWALAPSLHHATTAAVLHAGWAAHSHPDAFAVDLSSRRVRRALVTLEGLRAGYALEELLGYELERGLHDAQRDSWIPGFRHAYPLPQAATGDAPDAKTARREHGRRLVADGEAARRAGPDAAIAAARPASATDADATAVRAVLGLLDETVDAMGDALLAEGVHHLVGGSPLRAGLAADTVGRGNPPPDRLDVTRTPRRGVTVDHSIGLAVTPGPTRWASSPRAVLDPVAEAVAAWALGDPADWTLSRTPDSGPVTLAELGVAAIDVVAEASAPLDGSALADRVRGGTAGTVRARRADGLGGDDALAALADRTRALLALARARVAPGDCLDPHDGGPPADLAGLDGRVRTWWAAVAAALAAGPGGDPDALARLGLAGARFGAPVDSALRQRWAGRTLPVAPPPPVGTADEVASWLRQLRSDLAEAAGGWVLAAPLWNAPDAGWAALGGAPPDPAAEPVDDDAVDDWLAAHRDVTAGATELLDTLALVGACGGGGYRWIVRQHRPAPPKVEPVRGWVAREHPGPRSARHLAAVQVGAPQKGPRALLVVESWVDSVPLVTAGQDPAALAVRFDQPDSRAPQAVLIAVPPDPGRAWCVEDVQAAVEETLWWARARPLDSDDLPEMRAVLA